MTHCCLYRKHEMSLNAGKLFPEFLIHLSFVCSEVLASEAILNIPTRADWKECKQSREEEDECCKGLRDEFQPYDFAWDD